MGQKRPAQKIKPEDAESGQHSATLLVRQEGFEPPAYGLEVRCSIQLSYWRPHY